MKRFLFVILIVVSCGEPVDIEATIDARALKISIENISKISTATPQPQPTAQPTATPQPTQSISSEMELLSFYITALIALIAIAVILVIILIIVNMSLVASIKKQIKN